MARFKVFIEYEGTRYSGWQAQSNARTVQGELLRAMRNVFKTDNIELYGSGRTDAGVHALEQVAHLEVKSVLAPEIIRMKVNDDLPADINLLEVEKASPQFHARHDALGRSYLYQISRRRTAFGKRYVWWIKDRLDFQSMVRVSRLFIGMQDLRSFTDDDPADKSTTVKIEGLEMTEHGDLILMRIVGSHFIWKLVRRIVGTLVEVGRGTLTMDQVKEFIKHPSDAPSRWTAPPSGLFLEKVYFGGESPLPALRPAFPVSSNTPESDSRRINQSLSAR